MTPESRLLERVEALERQIRQIADKLGMTYPPVEKAPVEGSKGPEKGICGCKDRIVDGYNYICAAHAPKEECCHLWIPGNGIEHCAYCPAVKDVKPKEETASPLAEKIYPYVSNDHLSVVMLLINEAIHKARLDERKRIVEIIRGMYGKQYPSLTKDDKQLGAMHMVLSIIDRLEDNADGK